MPFLGQEQLDSSLQINKPVRGGARHLGCEPVVAEVALSGTILHAVSRGFLASIAAISILK
jgi:hypothetical protein